MSNSFGLCHRRVILHDFDGKDTTFLNKNEEWRVKNEELFNCEKNKNTHHSSPPPLNALNHSEIYRWWVDDESKTTRHLYYELKNNRLETKGDEWRVFSRIRLSTICSCLFVLPPLYMRKNEQTKTCRAISPNYPRVVKQLGTCREAIRHVMWNH